MLASVVVTGVHLALLAGLAAIGGGESRLLVAVLAGWQVAESAVAPARMDTADASAHAIGYAVLAVVATALVWPGVQHPGAIVLIALGVAARLWAIRTLGCAFLDGVARLPGHPRVTHGPYRLVGHPADLGLLAIALGTAVAAGSLVAAGVALGALLPLLLWRTRAEDRLWQRQP